MRLLGVAVLGLVAFPLMSLKQAEPATPMVVPYPPPMDRPARLPRLVVPEVPSLGAEPEVAVVRRKVKVTACSPKDSKIDEAYYAKNGYEGATYNIAAHYGTFPKGTLIRVPGYMEKSYPGKFWTVDSAGGPIIRRAASRGVAQIDVKFKGVDAVVKWGVQHLVVEVITPAAMRRWQAEHVAWEAQRDAWAEAVQQRAAIVAENYRRGYGDLGSLPEVPDRH